MGKTLLSSDLMALVAKGDKKAFEDLYRATYRQLFSFLLSLTADQDTARDIMQETYLKVYVSAQKYRDKGNPLAWIMTIGKNQFLMQKRKEKGNVVYIDDSDDSMQVPAFDCISDVEARETLEVMFRILSRQERCIVTLHDISGFKHKEIAELIELPAATVISKYNRAMKKLHIEAQKMGITEADDQYE